MIRRKDTLGHIDFMRGKYSIYNRHYLINMLNQMTLSEKERMRKGGFNELWRHLWISEATKSEATLSEATGRDESLSGRDESLSEVVGRDEHEVVSETTGRDEHEVVSEATLSEAPIHEVVSEATGRDENEVISEAPIHEATLSGRDDHEATGRDEHEALNKTPELLENTTIKPNPKQPNQQKQCSQLSQIPSQYKGEEHAAREKYNALVSGVATNTDYYTLSDLIDESNKYSSWEEAEWGFPKGRRNPQEKDYQCAMREFEEETGYPMHLLKNIQNILPFEEIFTGSNYKSYKHKYYLMYMPPLAENTSFPKKYDATEISKMEWKTYEQCLEVIRPYNIEKKNIITKVHECIQRYPIFYIQG
jgi:ADP-ribose pyrophosphatase YjhB (NUDIX family)